MRLPYHRHVRVCVCVCELLPSNLSPFTAPLPAPPHHPPVLSPVSVPPHFHRRILRTTILRVGHNHIAFPPPTPLHSQFIVEREMARQKQNQGQ